MARLLVILAIVLVCTHASLVSSQRSCAGGAPNLFDAVSRSRDLTIFASAIRVAEAVSIFTDPALAITLFVPIDYAFGNILPPGRGFFDLVPDVAIAQALVNYHAVDSPYPARLFDEDRRFNTALSRRGRQLKLELIADINSPSGWMVQGALNAANITATNIVGCNSILHIIDAVLLPDEEVLPIGTVTIGEAIEASEKFDMLLTPLQPGDEERREDARSRLMLGQVAITTEELDLGPEAEDDPIALILAETEDALSEAGGR